MIMQNCTEGQVTEVPIPGYSLAAGMTCCGADHTVPFHCTTAPPWSVATQNEGEAQEIASSPPRGSMFCWGDHPDPPMRNDTPVPFTIRHWLVGRQEMAVPDDADSDDDVHGDGS